MYDFLLMFHSNNGHMLSRFRDLARCNNNSGVTIEQTGKTQYAAVCLSDRRLHKNLLMRPKGGTHCASA